MHRTLLKLGHCVLKRNQITRIIRPFGTGHSISSTISYFEAKIGLDDQSLSDKDIITEMSHNELESFIKTIPNAPNLEEIAGDAYIIANEGDLKVIIGRIKEGQRNQILYYSHALVTRFMII